MKTQEIPPIIHLICLPPYTPNKAKFNLEHLAATHPDFEVKLHTSVPNDFIFKDLPVYGPAQLSALLRLDALWRYGGWYMDLDVNVNCNLHDLEKLLKIKRLTISQCGSNSICTFVSCCPKIWTGWEEIINHMLEYPRSAPGHYCTTAMKSLLKEKPICDFFPSNIIYSGMWLSHKGIRHKGMDTFRS